MGQLINLGYLTVGSEFSFNGEKFKVLSLTNKPINAVMCKNLHTNKREFFDIETIVESEGK